MKEDNCCPNHKTEDSNKSTKNHGNHTSVSEEIEII